MKIIGHRGARGHAPENTLLSLQTAMVLGADMVEFDVYALPSGELVLMHDHRVDRTTSGQGRTMHQKFSQLRSLDAGDGEKVPTLQEALDLVKGKIGVNIELKGRFTAHLVAKTIEAALQQPWWTPKHFLISSFDHHELQDFRSFAPEIPIAVLEHTIPLTYAASAQIQGAMAVNPNHEFLTREYVEDAHSRGLKVFAYTVNEPDDIEDMVRLGVDGVITDYPDRARAVLAMRCSSRARMEKSTKVLYESSWMGGGDKANR